MAQLDETAQEKIKDVWRRYDILARELEKSSATIKALETQVHMLEIRAKQMDSQKAIQDQVVEQRIEEVNRKNNEYLQEIERLRGLLNNGHNDRLEQ